MLSKAREPNLPCYFTYSSIIGSIAAVQILYRYIIIINRDISHNLVWLFLLLKLPTKIWELSLTNYFTHCWAKKRWIHVFLKGISRKWNVNSLIFLQAFSPTTTKKIATCDWLTIYNFWDWNVTVYLKKWKNLFRSTTGLNSEFFFTQMG